MTSRKAVMLVAFVLGAATVVALGSWLGTLYGNHHLDARRAADLAAQARVLRREARVVRLGQPLPPVLVWTVSGERAFEVRTLLPEGGILLLVSPGCDVCVESAQNLQSAISSVKMRPTRAILLASQLPGSEVFCHALAGRGVDLQLYCDRQEAFLRDFRITANPAYFILNKEGIVTDFGPGVPDASRLATMLVQE